MTNRKHFFGWIAIAGTVALTITLMVAASATGLAKVPEGGTLDEEESGGNAETISGPISATVDVSLTEWTITPSTESVKAGNIAFNVQNEGPAETHEMIILKTELAPEELPTEKDKSLDESGEGVESPGETHELDVGESQTVTVAMEPGTYVLVDNVVEKNLVHWTKKAYATLQVNP